MKVNKGGEDDISGCITVAEGLDEYFTARAIEEMKEDLKEHEFFVVENDGISGFISLDLKNENCAEISWLAVREEDRGKGLGKRLLGRAERSLQNKDVRILEVKTLSEEVDYEPYEHTRRFYERMGFILIETIDPYPGWEEGNPCAIYVKVIEN